MFNLSFLKVFSSICDTKSQFTLSESNGLVYKPHPRFLAQNLSKKVQLIHESLRYIAEKCASNVKKMKNRRKQNFEGEENNMQLDKEDTRRTN